MIIEETDDKSKEIEMRVQTEMKKLGTGEYVQLANKLKYFFNSFRDQPADFSARTDDEKANWIKTEQERLKQEIDKIEKMIKEAKKNEGNLKNVVKEIIKISEEIKDLKARNEQIMVNIEKNEKELYEAEANTDYQKYTEEYVALSKKKEELKKVEKDNESKILDAEKRYKNQKELTEALEKELVELKGKEPQDEQKIKEKEGEKQAAEAIEIEELSKLNLAKKPVDDLRTEVQNLGKAHDEKKSLPYVVKVNELDAKKYDYLKKNNAYIAIAEVSDLCKQLLVIIDNDYFQTLVAEIKKASDNSAVMYNGPMLTNLKNKALEAARIMETGIIQKKTKKASKISSKYKEMYKGYDKQGLVTQLRKLTNEISENKIKIDEHAESIIASVKEKLSDLMSYDVAGNLDKSLLNMRTLEGLEFKLKGIFDKEAIGLRAEVLTHQSVIDALKILENAGKALKSEKDSKKKALLISDISIAVCLVKRVITARILAVLRDKTKYEWYNHEEDEVVVDIWDLYLDEDSGTASLTLEVNPSEIAISDMSILSRDGLLKYYTKTKLLRDVKGEPYTKAMWRLKKRLVVTERIIVYVFKQIEVKANKYQVEYNIEEDTKELDKILMKGRSNRRDDWDKMCLMAQKATLEVISHMVNIVRDIGFYAFPREGKILDHVLGIAISFIDYETHSPIYQALFYDVYYFYIYLATKLLHGEGFNMDDKEALEYLPIYIQRQIRGYNDRTGENAPDLTEGLNMMLNTDFIDEIIDELEEYVTKPPVFESQKNFELVNKYANFNGKVDIHRGYIVEPEKCYIEWDEVMNLQGGLGEVPESTRYTNSMFGFKIIDTRPFENNLKMKFQFSRGTKSYFHTITNNSHLKYPTYRKSTRYNRGLRGYILTINGVSYPEIPLQGEADSSEENNKFFDELAKCISIENSKINRKNFAIDMSTTMYITRKLYGEPNAKMFKFDSDTNLRYIFKFGYDDETLGKCVIGISLENVRDKIVDMMDVDVLDVEIEFLCMPEDTVNFGDYTITTFVGTQRSIELNEMGELAE